MNTRPRSVQLNFYFVQLAFQLFAVGFSNGVWAIASPAKDKKGKKKVYVISSLCCRRRSGVLFNARRLDICLKTTGSPTCVLELHTQTLVYVFIVCLKVFLSV